MNFESNFTFLEDHDSQLANTIKWAEVYLQENPNICVVTIGQFCEFLAKKIADYAGVNLIRNEKQHNLVIRLKESGLFNDNICDKFHEIRRSRNDAYYNLTATYESALKSLKDAHELAVWYYKKFVNPYFIHTTPFIVYSQSMFATAKEIFSHYTNILKELENCLNNLNELKIKDRNFASHRQQIKRQEESLKQTIIRTKKQAESRYALAVKQQKNQSNNLHQYIKNIDLNLIKIETKIDDLKDFEFNSEISSLLREVYQRKQALERQKNELQRSLNQMNNNSLISLYSPSEKKQIESLLEELDNLMPNQVKYEEEVKKDIEEKQQEVKSLWLEVDFLRKFAIKQDIELPVISYNILFAIDLSNNL